MARTTALKERPLDPTARRAMPDAPLSPEDMSSGTVTASIPGQPSVGPASGPADPPASGGGPAPAPEPGSGGGAPAPSPSPGTGGGLPAVGGAPAGGNGAGSSADQFAGQAGLAFLDLLKNAVTPEALEAQNIILRRIALEGDVIPSRVPPPRNITEIGGYLNLLTQLGELDMRSQVLAGILGVAGPNPPLGWISAATALSFVPVVNDRPEGPAKPTLPVTVPVRSDFAGPLRTALDALHARGCLLPFASGPLALPPAGASGIAAATLDPLDYIGRILRIAAGVALVDPLTDAVVLARAAGTTAPYEIAVRCLFDGSVAVTPADFEAVQLSGGTLSTVALPGTKLVPVAPLLAAAGFAPLAPLPAPTVGAPAAWARLFNIGGLVAGATRLGDELRLLHSATEISASALAPMLNWTWNGTEFAP